MLRSDLFIVNLTIFRYSEAINILYQNNSFTFYQNDIIFDLQRTILPHRFASIRFLTVHWQFRYDLTFEPSINQTVTKPRAPWDIGTWKQACAIMAESMPGLREILIVVKGPFQSIDNIASMLQYLREIDVDKEEFWVRVPVPKSLSTDGPDKEVLNFRRMIREQEFPFHVFRDCVSGPDSGKQHRGGHPSWYQLIPEVKGRIGVLPRPQGVWVGSKYLAFILMIQYLPPNHVLIEYY
jgi:hypothetical protein